MIEFVGVRRFIFESSKTNKDMKTLKVTQDQLITIAHSLAEMNKKRKSETVNELLLLVCEQMGTTQKDEVVLEKHTKSSTKSEEWYGINLTDLEKQFLAAYLPDQDAYDFACCPYEVKEVAQMAKMKINTAKGVSGSLVKKGIIDIESTNNAFSKDQYELIYLGEMFRDNEIKLNSLIKFVS
jgi:hypothetical protein